jgi:hypothetical protein
MIDTPTLPAPLNPRLFYSPQAILDYNIAVADYYARQSAIEYQSRRAKGDRRDARRKQYDN